MNNFGADGAASPASGQKGHIAVQNLSADRTQCGLDLQRQGFDALFNASPTHGRASIMKLLGARKTIAPLALAIVAIPAISWEIEIQPSLEQIAAALDRGQAAAAARTPPDHLYTWFGSDRSHTKPHGFLMTKLDALAVMSAHFGLRGLRPSDVERDQVLADPHLLVSIVLFGDRPDFAVDSYVLLIQDDRKIVPMKVRFDGTADRSAIWPMPPAYRAKVIAFFRYTDLDPMGKSRLSVFPRSGGEVSFDLDFASMP
jgi:hypothetical protein